MGREELIQGLEVRSSALLLSLSSRRNDVLTFSFLSSFSHRVSSPRTTSTSLLSESRIPRSSRSSPSLQRRRSTCTPSSPGLEEEVALLLSFLIVRTLFSSPLSNCSTSSPLFSSSPLTDLPASVLDTLVASLTSAGFAPYLTAVGGSGVGFLHADQRATGLAPGHLKSGLETEPTVELDEWAKGRGKWGYA